MRCRVPVIGLVMFGVVAGCGTSGGAQPTAEAPTSEARSNEASPTSESTPEPTPYPHAQIDVSGGNPVIAAGSVWLVGEPNTVIRIDTVTDEVVATIEVDGRPHGLVADESNVWITVGLCASDDPASCTDGTIVRIDSATNEVAETIAIGTWGYAMAVHEGTIWVSSFEDDLVVRVDHEQRRVVAEIPVTDPTGIVASADGVWTSLHYTGLVARIDPATNEVTMLDTGTVATEFIALSDDAVWVTTGDRSLEVVVLDRSDNEIIGRIPAAWPQGIVVHEDIVWVAASGSLDPPFAYDSAVLAIDAHTMDVIGEYPLPNMHPDALATDGETVWVGCEGEDGRLCKLNVRAG